MRLTLNNAYQLLSQEAEMLIRAIAGSIILVAALAGGVVYGVLHHADR